MIVFYQRDKMKLGILIIGDKFAKLTLIVGLPTNLKLGVLSRNKLSEASVFCTERNLVGPFHRGQYE